MNNRYYHIIIDLINILLHFLASYVLIGFVVLLATKDTASVYRSLLLLPAPIISYLIGIHCKHIWSFLALHFVTAAVYIFISHNVFVTAIYIIYLSLLTIVSLNNKLKEEKSGNANSPLLLLSVFAAVYLLQNYLGTTDLNGLIFILAVLFILLYLLNMYLINFEGYFQKHAGMSNIPIKQMKLTNHILILFFISLCVIVMLFFTRLPLKELLSVAGGLLLSLLRAFFSLFSSNQESDLPMESQRTEPLTPFTDLMDDQPPSLIWQYIQNILTVLFTAALIAGAIALVLYGLYRLYQRFHKLKNNNFRDRTEFISPFDKKEGVPKNPFKASGKKFFHIFGRSYNDKIRKHFYKAVISGSKARKIPANLTPRQLSEYAFTGKNSLSGIDSDKEKAELLAAYYEKARYGKEECTKEELLAVKNILGK